MIRVILWPLLYVYALFIRWCIWEAENHLRACAVDRLDEGMSLREFRAQIDRDRVRLADVQARMNPICKTRGLTP